MTAHRQRARSLSFAWLGAALIVSGCYESHRLPRDGGSGVQDDASGLDAATDAWIAPDAPAPRTECPSVEGTWIIDTVDDVYPRSGSVDFDADGLPLSSSDVCSAPGCTEINCQREPMRPPLCEAVVRFAGPCSAPRGDRFEGRYRFLSATQMEARDTLSSPRGTGTVLGIGHR